LCFDPVAIPGLTDYSFTMAFRGATIDVAVSGSTAQVSVRDGREIRIRLGGQDVAPDGETPCSRVS